MNYLLVVIYPMILPVNLVRIGEIVATRRQLSVNQSKVRNTNSESIKIVSDFETCYEFIANRYL